MPRRRWFYVLTLGAREGYRTPMAMTLIRTYTADPADLDPNTQALTADSASTTGVFEVDPTHNVGIRDSPKNLTRNTEKFLAKWLESNADVVCTVVVWMWDATSARWGELSSSAGIATDEAFSDETGPGVYYLQLTKTAGTAPSGGSPMTLYAEAA